MESLRFAIFINKNLSSEILDQYTKENGWHQVNVQQVTRESKQRKPKVEVLTANYPISLCWD